MTEEGDIQLHEAQQRGKRKKGAFTSGWKTKGMQAERPAWATPLLLLPVNNAKPVPAAGPCSYVSAVCTVCQLSVDDIIASRLPGCNADESASQTCTPATRSLMTSCLWMQTVHVINLMSGHFGLLAVVVR